MGGSFADRLRAARHAAGLSQQELAERAGLTVNAVSQLERGVRTRPYPHTVRALAEALSLDEPARAQLLRSVPSRSRGPSAPPDWQLTERRGRLPRSQIELIGREDDVAAILAELQRTRLLTLTGPGGVGKTSLAITAAHLVTGREVVFVPLAAVTDADGALRTIAEALAVPDVASDMREHLVAALDERPAVLLLDNLEQIDGLAAVLADLVDTTDVTVLATSRSPMHLRVEQVWPVAPLPTPLARAESGDTRTSPAVELLVERARRQDPGFTPDPPAWRTLGEICRRLDGLPLAIELVASWLTVLSADDLLTRLSGTLDLLADDRHDRPERHRTMRGAIAWSHGLLEPGLQGLFRALSVFPATFDLEAAAAIANTPEPDVLRGLAVLTERSLVQRVATGVQGQIRFRMLEIVRAYAAEQLESAGEGPAVRGRHAELVADLGDQASVGLDTADQALWLQRVEDRFHDVRVALRWHLDDDRAVVAARLYAQLRMVWYLRHAGEGLMWGQQVLARDGVLEPRDRGPARSTLALLEFGTGDLVRARAEAEAAVADCRADGDAHGTGLALIVQANVAVSDGRAGEARALADAARTEAAAMADRNRRHLMLAFASLASVRASIATGDLDDAERFLAEADRDLAVACQPWARAFWLNLAMAIDRMRGRTASVPARLRQAIDICLELGDVPALLYAMAGLSSHLLSAGDPEAAARVAGAVTRTVERTGYQITDPTTRSRMAADAAAMEASLDAETVATATEHGAATELADLLEDVLSTETTGEQVTDAESPATSAGVAGAADS